MNLSICKRPYIVCVLLLAFANGKAQFNKLQQLTSIQQLFNKASSLEASYQYDSAKLVLSKVLQLSKNESYKPGEAMAYDKLAEIMHIKGDYDGAQKIDSLAYPLAQHLHDTALLINCHNRKGIYELQLGNYPKAEQSFTEAHQLALHMPASVRAAETYSNFGSLNLILGNKDKASESFFTALRLFEKNNHQQGVGETLSNISSVYYLLGKMPDAIAYQQKSIDIRQNINDKMGMVNSLSSLGQYYILSGKNEQAFQHFKQSIALAEQLNNEKQKAISYAAMSIYFIKTRDYKEALQWQTKAVNSYEAINDKPMLSRMYVAIGGLANAISDSLTVVNYYTKALSIAKELANKENIANAYEKLTAFYSDHNDPKKALDYNKKYFLYRDSITEKSNASKIEEVRTIYETEKKDKEIFYLNTQQKIKQLQIEKQAAELAGNILEAEKKSNEIELLSKTTEVQDLRILQQDEILEKQHLQAKNTAQQLLLAKNEKLLKDKQLTAQKTVRNLLLAGLLIVVLLAWSMVNRFKLKRTIQQQAEMLAIRNSISQNLHDEIGSTLTSISILSNVSQKAIKQQPLQAQEMLQQIAEQSKTIQQNMSDIVWSIRPDNEQVLNLVTRMREYASQTLDHLGVNVVIKADEQLETRILPMQHRKEMLLIYKEAINNIAKHAGATHVAVSIVQSLQQIKLEIHDNGTWKGNNSGTGTHSMKSRAQSLGGSLAIDIAGNGTTITANIPIP